MNDRSAIGLEAFEALRAEAEPWLMQAFEPPPEFDLLCGQRSCVIYGEAGSGKSAVYRALIQRALAPTQSARWLVAEWKPRIPDKTDHLGAAFVKCQVAEIFDACALSVIRYLLTRPDDFGAAPAWAQRILHWFIHRKLTGDWEERLDDLQSELSVAGAALLQQLMGPPEREQFKEDAAAEEVIARLVSALAKVKLSGVWVLVDRLEVGDEQQLPRLAATLRPFLSSLNLFEQNGFAYKFFLPQELRSHLTNVSGLERQRLSLHYLQWSTDKLAALVLKRLALATGGDVEQITQVCSDPGLLAWLEWCGGLKPRGWLRQFDALAAAYLERSRNGQSQPISTEEWRAIRQRHPPLLTFEPAIRLIRIGERKVELTEEQFKIFNYLYANAGKICTRGELYFRAYLGKENEPRSPADEGYEALEEYRGLIETTIYRLRQVIEPDDQEEMFIITVKGKGYRLDHT
jgi:DNA-binding winged helix-turn-helix (wHTH) protein